MAIKLTELAIKLQAQGAAQVNSAFSGIGKEAKKLRSNIVDLLNPATAVKSAIGGIAAGISVGATAAFLKSAVEEARDAQDVLAQLRVAVENTGVSFDKAEPAIDRAAGNIQKLTRYSDDAARGALTRLISISGDVAGSIGNLGLVADVAARKNIDLGDAADIVGKLMTGNTKVVKEFGITTKDSSVAIEQLRGKMRGFAEADAGTLTGSLAQVENAWADVKEEIGNVILGTDDLGTSTNTLRDALVNLKNYIADNADEWRRWGRNLLDEDWGPVKVLNTIDRWINKVGLGIHGLITGDFAALRAFNAGGFGDVTGGGSSSTKDSLPPMVITPGGRPSQGGGGGKGKGNGKAAGSVGGPVAKAPIIGITPSSAGSGMMELIPEDAIDGAIEKMQQMMDEKIVGPGSELMRVIDESAASIRTGVAETLGDAVYNGFAAAFEGKGVGGILEAFGRTIMAGLGQIFTTQGQALITYGLTMMKLTPFLTNLFTAGPAALAAGFALVGLGAAFGAIGGKGGGGRGTAAAGAFREPNTGESMVRLKFVDRVGALKGVEPIQPLMIQVLGPNDPRTTTFLGRAQKAQARTVR